MHRDDTNKQILGELDECLMNVKEFKSTREKNLRKLNDLYRKKRILFTKTSLDQINENEEVSNR